MAPFVDHYRTLGVHRHADPAVIEAAYRALARQHHPDVNQGVGTATERQKQINAAYEVLSNPTERQNYNRLWDAHHAPKAPPKAPNPPPTEKATSQQSQTSPPPPQPRPRAAKGRGKRPWWVNVLAAAALIIALRSISSSISTSGQAPRTAQSRQATRVPTSTPRPSATRYVPTEASAPRATSASTAAPTSHSLDDYFLTPLSGASSPSWGFIDNFSKSSGYPERSTDLASSYVIDDGFVVHIKRPGGIDGVIYDSIPTNGRDFKFRVQIESTSGWGEFTMDLTAVEAGGPSWTFAVDPVAKEWSLYRSSDTTSELFYWVEPRPFSRIAGETPKTVEVRVINDAPTLLINGVDVVEPYGIEMPKMPESIYVGFGAGVNPFSITGSGNYFTAIFEQVDLTAISP